VEIGESVTDAVAREVREETGLTIAARRLVGVYSEPRLQVVRYPDGNVWHYVNVCFECVVRGGTLTTCDETLALEWVALDALPAALLPNHRIRIRDARARRVAAFVR
jgi:ADP-ribose pyrophosphatase YjhB (NUDIX family)